MNRWVVRRAVGSRGFLALAVGLLGVAVWTLTAGRARSDDVQPKSTAELVEARLKLAHDILKDLRNGRPGQEDRTTITLWLKRVAQTRHEYGGRTNEAIADLKAYADHMIALESQVVDQTKAGLLTEYDRLEARYLRLEAESWLSEASEKLKK